MYKDDIVKHYIQHWQNQPEVFSWTKGPIDKLPTDFRVLVFPPTANRSMWTYATWCMSQNTDANPVELHLYSSKEDTGIVELLTTLAYYHNNTSAVDLHHTVNFGRGWQDNSPCSYGYISLPYLDGPILESLTIQNSTVKFYWLIPVTKEEVDYKVQYGAEGLEEKFDNGFDYLNPQRKTVIS
jgi:hypothetical protein